MLVLKYERRFHDLSLFAQHYMLTEEHMIEKLRYGLRQDLRQGLIALRFKSVRELIEAAQALETCIRESQGGHQGIGKKRDGDYFSGRPPLPKKGKGGMFKQYRKKGSLMLPPHQQSSGRVMVGQSHSRANSSTGTGDHKGIDYPFCIKYGQKPPGDCSVSPGRCFVCRGEGHRWRNCQYMGQGCHYYGGRGHYKWDCPKRNTGQVQSYRQLVKATNNQSP